MSHFASAALWRISSKERLPIDVSVPRYARSRPDIAIHRTSPWHEDDLAERDGVPLTSPARTVLDCAGVLDAERLTRLLRNAGVNRIVTHDQIRRVLERHPRAPGRRQLISLLDEGERASRSRREDDWVDVLEALGLEPRVNGRVAGRERDIHLPEHNLVVEVDSERWHGTPTAALLDARRDEELAAVGLRTLRVREAPRL